MLHEFVVNEETRQLTARFFVLLKQEYHGKPDEELPTLFSILLQTAMIRKHHAIRMLHYSDTQVKFGSMAESLSTTRLFHKDEELRGLQLYENEYIRLSMLLLPYFHQLDTQVYSHAGVIVNRSSELTHHGRMRVSEALPNIDIMRILTEGEIDTATAKVDFFTTPDYLHKQVPNMGISSMMQDSNIQRPQFYLKQLRQQ